MTKTKGTKMKIIDHMPDESLLMTRGKNMGAPLEKERRALLEGKVLQFEIDPDGRDPASQCSTMRGYWERRLPEGTKVTVRRSIDGRYGYVSVRSGAPGLRSVQ